MVKNVTLSLIFSSKFILIQTFFNVSCKILKAFSSKGNVCIKMYFDCRTYIRDSRAVIFIEAISGRNLGPKKLFCL